MVCSNRLLRCVAVKSNIVAIKPSATALLQVVAAPFALMVCTQLSVHNLAYGRAAGRAGRFVSWPRRQKWRERKDALIIRVDGCNKVGLRRLMTIEDPAQNLE